MLEELKIYSIFLFYKITSYHGAKTIRTDKDHIQEMVSLKVILLKS